MVDRSPLPLGKSFLGDSAEPSEYKVKGTTRKRRRPEISPHIRGKIVSFQPLDISDSPVRKFLKQFEFNDTETIRMPKSGSRSSSSSPD